MQIEKIELENWMSYPRRWQQDGEEKRPTIALTNESLTLIAGENGAGKSAILEAICYALFARYPRSSSYRSAIRNGEKEARVRLFFSLPDGQGKKNRFCVERGLTTKGMSNATLHQLVGESDNDKVLRAERQQTVTDYIQDKLLAGISYDTFVSSIFLRQQAAGKFMELTGGEQREQLLSLCRLEIYEEIRKKANELRREANARFVDLSEQFQRFTEATAEALTDQKDEVSHCEHLLAEKQAAQKTAETIVRQTQRAAKLAQDIAEQEDKLTRWQQFLAQKTEIELADKWHGAWQRVEPLIQEGRGLQTAVYGRNHMLEKITQQITDMTPTVAQAETEYEAAEANLKTVQEALSARKDHLIALTNEYNDVKTQLSELKRAKELDESIARDEREQAERADELERYNDVHQQYELLRQLRETQSVLQKGMEHLAEADELAERIAEQEQQNRIVEQNLRLVEEQLKGQDDEQKRLKIELEKLRTEEGTAVTDKKTLSNLLSQRQQALEAGRCPTCGLDMTGEIGEHVHEEAEDLEEQLAALAKRIATVQRQIEVGERQVQHLEQAVSQTQQQRDTFDKRQVQLGYEISNRKGRATTLNDRVQEQWRQHHETWPTQIAKPKWLSGVTGEVLARVETAVVAWDDVASDYDYLGRVQTEFDTTADYLHRNRDQRSSIPIGSPATDETILAQAELCERYQAQIKDATLERDALTAQVSASKRVAAQTKEALVKWQRALADVQTRQTQLETEQRVQTQRLQQVQASLAEVEATRRDELSDLAPRLLLAVEDESIWADLQQLAHIQATKALHILAHDDQ